MHSFSYNKYIKFIYLHIISFIEISHSTIAIDAVVSDIILLLILDAPQYPANLSLSRAFVSLNDTLNFTCIPNDVGNPPAVKWQLMKINISNPLAVLNVYEVFVKTINTYYDNGIYYCIVYNAFGSSSRPPVTQLKKLVVTAPSSSDYVTTAYTQLVSSRSSSTTSMTILFFLFIL